MTNQDYLIIENNVVTNVVMWDGDSQTWAPLADSIQLVQSTTPAMVWTYDSSTNDFKIEEKIGVGSIDFTWDGARLTTNADKPTPKQ